MVTGSGHSINMCPPHSPTLITKKSILKLPGAFHWRKTSRIRFWAFSYSIGEPCERSNQLSTYFIGILLKVVAAEPSVPSSSVARLAFSLRGPSEPLAHRGQHLPGEARPHPVDVPSYIRRVRVADAKAVEAP